MKGKTIKYIILPAKKQAPLVQGVVIGNKSRLFTVSLVVNSSPPLYARSVAVVAAVDPYTVDASNQWVF